MQFKVVINANREIKGSTFLLVFCSLSLEGKQRAEVTQLDYQHLWDPGRHNLAAFRRGQKWP